MFTVNASSISSRGNNYYIYQLDTTPHTFFIHFVKHFNTFTSLPTTHHQPNQSQWYVLFVYYCATQLTIQPPKSSVASKAPSSQAAKAPAAASKAPAKVCLSYISLLQVKLIPRPQRPPPLRLTVVRRGPRRGSRPTLLTSTRSSSRSTPTLVSRKSFPFFNPLVLR